MHILRFYRTFTSTRPRFLGGLSLGIAALLAQPIGAQTASAPAQTVPPPAADNSDLQEIVVTATGTSIRGSAPIGSELQVVSRSDIDATSATTSTELLRTVPTLNNFNSTGANVGNNQAGFVDQPAIHGIGVGNGGAGLTLVLVDGHRLPGAGVNQTAPDAGAIPTSALERVEVLADGGSSIYGSDAVAGVLNFITRKDFNGAETTAKDGFGDGYKTWNFSQLFGKTWETGHILFDYEYSGNRALNGMDRSYAVNDQRSVGGPDSRSNVCSPANITAGGVNYALSATGAPIAGATNLCEANRANDLYPEQFRNQGYLSISQEIGDHVDVYGSFLYSNRNLYDHVAGGGLATGGLSVTVPSTSPYYVALPGVAAGTPESVTYNPSSDFGPTFENRIQTNTLSTVLGTNFAVGGGWHGNFELNYGEERDDVREYGIDQSAATTAAAAGTFNPTGIGAANNPAVLAAIGNYITRYYAKQTIKEGQLKFDGPIVDLPGGSLKAAAGFDAREEGLDGSTESGPSGLTGFPTLGPTSTGPYVSDATRQIRSVFLELHVPVVGDANAIPGVKKLDVALSGRYDHYSDVGGTTNPKLGINWTIVDGLLVRASAGRSFHAPSLADAPTAIDTRAIQYGCSPGNIGCAGSAAGAYGVILAGGNKLQPETAHTYNLGVDWTPEFVHGLTANLTYFRVDYDNVITFPTFAPVTNPLSAYDKYRTVRPAGETDAEWAATVEALLAGFRDQGLIYPANPNLPVAIYDLRRQNFADELINGFDYSLNYKFDTSVGNFVTGLSGTQFTTFYQRIPGVAGVIQLLDTDYAIRTKARATVAWSRGQLGAQLFLNYTGRYRNETFTPYQEVSSFTTADVHLAWTPPLSGILENTQLSVDILNVANRDPPVFYTNSNTLPGWDPVAANALGRVVSFGVHKKW
jgi:iron complex outermembrane recepter protein